MNIFISSIASTMSNAAETESNEAVIATFEYMIKMLNSEYSLIICLNREKRQNRAKFYRHKK